MSASSSSRLGLREISLELDDFAEDSLYNSEEINQLQFHRD